MSKRPKRQRRAFPLSFLSSALVQVLLALVEGIGANKTARTMDISTPRYSKLVGFVPKRTSCLSFVSRFTILPITLFMASIPRRHGCQFKAEEIDKFLDIVETYLPISAQNWQFVADSHLENYPWEQQTAESSCAASSRKYPVGLVPRVTRPAPPMSSRPRRLTGS